MDDVTRMDIARTNVILYCRQWKKTIDFYQHILGQAGRPLSDWLVEFELTETSFISIADAGRATVGASGGTGITLSLRVEDLEAWRLRLAGLDVAAGPIRQRWGTRFFYFHDPEGHRLEAWDMHSAS
jgi:catechol 2,3-dioxygenase-like lactoylglutathione lyase family enzyme